MRHFFSILFVGLLFVTRGLCDPVVSLAPEMTPAGSRHNLLDDAAVKLEPILRLKEAGRPGVSAGVANHPG